MMAYLPNKQINIKNSQGKAPFMLFSLKKY